MSNSVYIAAAASGSGKSLVLLGMAQMLSSRVERLGVFRPIIRSLDVPDYDIELVRGRNCKDQSYRSAWAVTHDEAQSMLADGQDEQLLRRIHSRFMELSEACDFVLVEGTDYTDIDVPFSADFNALIAGHLGCPVLVVTKGDAQNEEELIELAHRARETFAGEGCTIVATILNHVPQGLHLQVADELGERIDTPDPVFLIPEHYTLSKPTVGEVFRSLDGQVVQGYREWLKRDVIDMQVAAMTLSNFLDHIKDGDLIITPGDRTDIVIGCVSAMFSETFPSVAGIVLTGGLSMPPQIAKLIKGVHRPAIPIMQVDEFTFETANRVASVHSRISPDNERKVNTALALFERHVDMSELRQRVDVTRSTTVTPIMFEYRLIEHAKRERQHIVLPEGEEERILRAADTLLQRSVVDLTLLGDERIIRERIAALQLDLRSAKIIDPKKSAKLDDYARKYFELRKHKNITKEYAYEMMSDSSYFGTMMVYLGEADGMVSGSVHTTANTIRPALQLIKMVPDCEIVSSVLLMCLEDRVLVYADCAINIDPSAKELASIAISSAETAAQFGIEPRVAMLSYSTGQSGTGEEVEKVREATRLVRERRPDILVEGPIQYDAAIDPGVAQTKMRDSEVAGRATVFIFPDLNTGNNTYKAVQRSAGAIAVGPVLQGLKKPVNDLSRGCTVSDIVNTVAITAIQAQQDGNG